MIQALATVERRRTLPTPAKTERHDLGPMRLSISMCREIIANTELTASAKLCWLWLDAQITTSSRGISQAELGAELGMSRNGVRKAIAQLLSFNLVARLSGSGYWGRDRLFTLKPWVAVQGPEQMDAHHEALLRELQGWMCKGQGNNGNARHNGAPMRASGAC